MSDDREKAEIILVVHIVTVTVLMGLAVVGVHPFREYFIESFVLLLAATWIFSPVALAVNPLTRSVSVLDLRGPRERAFKWSLICAAISGAVASIVWRSLA